MPILGRRPCFRAPRPGMIGGTLVFCMPGSTSAVRLAMEQLIVPQLPHLIWETVRQSTTAS